MADCGFHLSFTQRLSKHKKKCTTVTSLHWSFVQSLSKHKNICFTMYSALLKHQLCNGFLQIIDCGNSRNVRTDLLPCSGQILGCRTSSGCLWGLLCWNLWTSSGCFSSLLVEVNNGTARHVVIRLVVTSSTTATKCAKPSVLSLSSHLRFCTFSHVLDVKFLYCGCENSSSYYYAFSLSDRPFNRRRRRIVWATDPRTGGGGGLLRRRLVVPVKS